MTEYHEEILEQLVASMPPQLREAGPGPAFTHMNGLFLDYMAEHSMIASFPVKPEYANSLGVVQGGFVAAAIDNVFGCFALLTTKQPCATITMNLSYIRPVKVDEGDMTVEVKVIQQTRSLFFVSGKLSNGEGRTACTASATMVIHKDLEKALK